MAAVFQENANEADLKRRLEEARKSQQANQAGQGPSYLTVYMPRLLKQRCEEFAVALDKRPPIYLGGAGRGGLDRFLAEKKTLCGKIGLSTWTNFYDLGWQRQYHWRKHTPSWAPGGGGGGGGGGSAPPRQPIPPSYQGPPNTGGPPAY